MILVADDDDAYQLLLPRLFDKADSPVSFRFVFDGEQAIEYLGGTGRFADRAEHPMPKMVLLDIKMPRMNGFEVLEWKVKQPNLADIPVVVWSSSELQSDIDKALKLGVEDYIVKPIIGQGLIAVIERIYTRLTEARERAARSAS